MHITGLELGWESEFSELQIYGVRRRFYNYYNINEIGRYG